MSSAVATNRWSIDFESDAMELMCCDDGDRRAIYIKPVGTLWIKQIVRRSHVEGATAMQRHTLTHHTDCWNTDMRARNRRCANQSLPLCDLCSVVRWINVKRGTNFYFAVSVRCLQRNLYSYRDKRRRIYTNGKRKTETEVTFCIAKKQNERKETLLFVEIANKKTIRRLVLFDVW